MCERVTTTKIVMLLIKASDFLTDVQWLLYLQDCGCDCMILIQAGVTPSHADAQWLQLQDHGCKIVREASYPVNVLCTISKYIYTVANHSVVSYRVYAILQSCQL